MACALTVLGAGCQGYSTDFSAPVAIAITTTRVPPFYLEQRDTLRLAAQVLDRAGDSVPGAVVRLLALDTTVVVDSAIFAVTGLTPGPGRVIALSGNLQSAPLTITVVPAPDSLGATSPVLDTVPAADTGSAPLAAALFVVPAGAAAQALTWGPIGDTVHFAIVYPAFASLAAATVTLGNDSLAAAVTTSLTVPGTASVVVRRQGPPPQPDSVVVQATAHRASGAAVRGSPVQFILRFQ